VLLNRLLLGRLMNRLINRLIERLINGLVNRRVNRLVNRQVSSLLLVGGRRCPSRILFLAINANNSRVVPLRVVVTHAQIVGVALALVNIP
jgi:hypothetical protein